MAPGISQIIKVTTKKTSGPPGPMARRKWKKIGAATKEKQVSPAGTEVFFVTPQKRNEEWIPNGIYVESARKLNWSDQEIKRIVRSNQPDSIYEQIYRNKINQLASIKNTNKYPMATVASEAAALVNQKMGIRERLLLKQHQQSNVPVGNPKTSLSARMNQIHGGPRNETKCTLFLENIPEDYTESDIKNHISNFQYRRVNIVRRDGQSMGKAFIELDSEDETTSCLSAIDGQRWSYYIISAQFSKPKKVNQ
jgi:hypothetical protein